MQHGRFAEGESAAGTAAGIIQLASAAAGTHQLKQSTRMQKSVHDSKCCWLEVTGCGSIARVCALCLCCQLLHAALTMHMVLCSGLCLLCTGVASCTAGEAARVKQQKFDCSPGLQVDLSPGEPATKAVAAVATAAAYG